MFKLITSYLQRRAAVRTLTLVLNDVQQHAPLVIPCSALANYIVKTEAENLPAYVGSGQLPKHLLHPSTVVVYCLGNCFLRVADNDYHPDQAELSAMYLNALNNVLPVLMHPSAANRLDLTAADDEIIAFTAWGVSNRVQQIMAEVR